MINSITGMSVKWLIGRKRPGAGRPVTICRSPEPVHLPAIPMRCVVWLVGTNNTDVYGLHIRGVPSGSWLLYQGRIFRKKRIYRKRTDGESERELGTESEQWRDLMQEDSDAFLEACLDDPELMKELFPGLWRQRIGDDGDIKELLGAEYYNERPDEKTRCLGLILTGSRVSGQPSTSSAKGRTASKSKMTARIPRQSRKTAKSL